MGNTPRPKLNIIHLGPPKGRGVVTNEAIQKGSYVCEYRTYRVYPVGSDLSHQLACEYHDNSEGSFVIQTAYCIANVGRLCFDATRRYRDVGRLRNHSATTPNLKLSRPLHVRGKWSLALLALRDIKPQEEVRYDYGVRSLHWMQKRPRKQTTEEEGSVTAGILEEDEVARLVRELTHVQTQSQDLLQETEEEEEKREKEGGLPTGAIPGTFKCLPQTVPHCSFSSQQSSADEPSTSTNQPLGTFTLSPEPFSLTADQRPNKGPPEQPDNHSAGATPGTFKC